MVHALCLRCFICLWLLICAVLVVASINFPSLGLVELSPERSWQCSSPNEDFVHGLIC